MREPLGDLSLKAKHFAFQVDNPKTFSFKWHCTHHAQAPCHATDWTLQLQLNDHNPMSLNQTNKSKPITDVPATDIGKLMTPGAEPRQPLQGFDSDYVDIVDYIVRCTHKIWEEKNVGLIYTHYTHNAVIHTPSNEVYGSAAVVANTIQALNTFPDRRIFADDVVWSGNEVDGFYTSHRITSLAHHTGYGHYGPPSGKALRYRVFADCRVKANRIYEEWLIRDELSILRQLGLDENEFVRRLTQKLSQRIKTNEHGALEDARGQLPPAPLPARNHNHFDPEDFVRRAMHDVWNRKLFGQIYACYAPTFQCHSASGRELYGQDDYLHFVLSWLACFPDAQMHVDHFCALGDEASGYRTATRWTLLGTHEGHGIYGAPTGKRVRIMGITQQHIQCGKFVAEWTLFDELNLLAQLQVVG